MVNPGTVWYGFIQNMYAFSTPTSKSTQHSVFECTTGELSWRMQDEQQKNTGLHLVMLAFCTYQGEIL